MMERSTQVSLVLFVILGLGIIYVGHQANVAQKRVKDLRETENKIVKSLQEIRENLKVRIRGLEEMIIDARITIDNGDGSITKEIHLTKGATALEALNRVAAVGAKTSRKGVFVTSINGVSNVRENNLYWMFYTWSEKESKWKLIQLGVGSYRLHDGENFKASFEKMKW
ncbi:hypothetical protein AKJ65_06280 [candidate division MSBL1 archaeon SCGC-AAA259E19]|uniref:Transcobalamin-like C-terminal domain-containing protein n=2 Tax=candidate division MSBL1 TaxID=215777 RepID=A0A133UFR3_9EURY|nr:hypothetical protein AKJ64_01475 [candidate division MSBL1 archaeon SCGC-AAA259E17]KXA93459.1 hypothetical protein AKJ65_06280 [candidate division MSBL1 archaeon SCGC-AAA259E19]